MDNIHKSYVITYMRPLSSTPAGPEAAVAIRPDDRLVELLIGRATDRELKQVRSVLDGDRERSEAGPAFYDPNAVRQAPYQGYQRGNDRQEAEAATLDRVDAARAIVGRALGEHGVALFDGLRDRYRDSFLSRRHDEERRLAELRTPVSPEIIDHLSDESCPLAERAEFLLLWAERHPHLKIALDDAIARRTAARRQAEAGQSRLTRWATGLRRWWNSESGSVTRDLDAPVVAERVARLMSVRPEARQSLTLGEIEAALAA